MPPGQHCAIIGTCLSLKATRSILRKARFAQADQATDYEVHCTAVELAQHGGVVAKLLDKALERKSRKAWAVYSRLTTAEALRAQWRRDVEAGDISGPFWAVTHHPATDRDLRTESFGVIHMLSHQVGGSCRQRLQRYDDVKTKLREVRRQLAETKGSRGAEVQALGARLAEQVQLLEEQRRQTAAWRRRAEAGDPERVRALEAERDQRIRALARTERHLSHARETIARLREDLQNAERALDEQRRADRRHTPEEADAYDPGPPEESDGDFERRNPCDDCDLDGCTVLYVGGEKRLLPHLRRVAKAANGRLLHHDGGIEDNLNTLPRLCARADVILCPISKVGHQAVGQVKKTCTETCKLFIPLRRASLEAFSLGLSRAVANRQHAPSGPGPESDALH